MKKRIAFAYHFNDRDWLGGRNYFASLFGALEAIASEEFEFVLITGSKVITNLPQEFPWLEHLSTSLLDRLQPLWFIRQISLRSTGTDPLLEHFLTTHHIDLLSHSGPLRKGARIKSLPWLYDFQFMHLPQYWEPKHIRWAESRYRAACRHGDGLILSSNDAANDLKAFAPGCRIPLHVLQFVSNPVDFSRVVSKAKIQEKYNLPATYFYLPNQFWTSKNHRVVIDALAVLLSQGKAVTVVCTGKEFDGRRPEYFNELMLYREEKGVKDTFRVLGVVPYADLQSLMAHACAVVNPSRFEGWSTTVEEAKTLHCRLLLSDISVHREQSPSRASFFGVDDAPELARLLHSCASELQTELSEDEIRRDYATRLSIFGNNFLNVIRRTV